MGTQERRERERLETREKILDAARELFISEGYEGVSMRKVAQKIEYSPTAIYTHFPDKEQLFLELCHSDYRRLASAFIKLAAVKDPVERLRKVAYAYIDFGQKNPFHYRMMFMTPHPAVEEDLEKQGQGNPEEDAYAFLREAVKEALNLGAFRPELQDADLISQTLWAGVHGVISLHIAKDCDAWVPWRSLKKRSDLVIEGMLHGLLQDKG